MNAPYWIAKDELPGNDFNRAIVEPGAVEGFPDGAVAIYVDDDFWCVGALPLAEYRDASIQQIVSEHWPHYVAGASYAPDHGTVDQRVFQLEGALASERQKHDWLWEEFQKVRAENERYRRGRTDVAPRDRTKHEMSANYFVRQYEHLLIATAHEAVPRSDLPGLCEKCGLYCSGRVHMRHWIERHSAGYKGGMEWAGEFSDEQPSDSGSHPQGENRSEAEG